MAIPSRAASSSSPRGTHYIDEGQGEPLLFLHGTPTWFYEGRHLIRALAPSRRCIARDLLGFGLSDRPRGFAWTPEAVGRELRERTG
jgi:pimeloyl-ACP methyl ester carboxylesterase